MKTKLILSAFFTFVFYLLSSQVPQGFNYQAIARDGSYNPIINTTIKVEMTLQSDSLGTIVLWRELHSSVTTNSLGLFTLVLGRGVRQTGLPKFSDINWSVSPVFINTKIEYPTPGVWKNMGTTRLWSVPYAMSSGNLSQIKKLTVKGDKTYGDSTLFEVKNSKGQTVFAVYNEGVRIYVADGDSSTLTKGKTKGGFAIGGFETGKGSQEYLRVTRDSTRVYVNPNPPKGTTKGGFAIGGFSPGKGGDNNYLDMTPQNYFIGQGAGKSNVGGLFNAYIGTQAGYLNTSGNYNIILGRQAGYNNLASSNIYIGDWTAKFNSTGSQNVMIGDWAGYNNTFGSQNVFLGAEAGWSNTIGNFNNFMGFRSGYLNNSGSYNSFIGYQAGYSNTTGKRNTYLGYKAGYSGSNASGSNNIFMGDSAGYSNTTGYDNIAIGNGAGSTIQDGYYNVMIGSDAGTKNASGDYNTIIGYKAGEKTTSNYGTMVGYHAGSLTTTGVSQTMFGYEAGYMNTGQYNTFIGVLAGGNSGYGQDNTYVGLAAGDYATGNSNVFLGQFAGYNESGSNKLIISTGYTGSDNLNNALIYGEFNNKRIKFNGKVGVNTYPGNTRLYVVDDSANVDFPAIIGQHNVTINWGVGVKGIGGFKGVEGVSTIVGGGARFGVYGDASGSGANYGVFGNATSAAGATSYGVYGSASTSGGTAYAGYFAGAVTVTGTLTYPSDNTLKKNILPISGSLQKILKLQGVSYEWKSESELTSAGLNKKGTGKGTDIQSFNFPKGLQLGVIAQDVEKIVPELVRTDADGLKSVDYTKIIPLLIEAIKDQQKQIDELKAQVNLLSGQVKK